MVHSVVAVVCACVVGAGAAAVCIHRGRTGLPSTVGGYTTGTAGLSQEKVRLLSSNILIHCESENQ